MIGRRNGFVLGVGRGWGAKIIVRGEGAQNFVELHFPAGTTRWINVEIELRTTSRPYFNYISTLFQHQMPAGFHIERIRFCTLVNM